jgi:hypothetical protein
LGSILTENNEGLVEITSRISAANKTYYSLLPVFRSRDVHRKTKITLYKTINRTVLSYGCEAWTLTARAAETLDVFERKVLRRICGPVKEGDVWRIRTNEELHSIYQAPSISTHIRLMRLRWAGHVQRMPDLRIPKRILTGHPGGKRRVGRPRIRWEDDVNKDAVQILNVNGWRTAAGDKRQWRQTLQEAKARYGL